MRKLYQSAVKRIGERKKLIYVKEQITILEPESGEEWNAVREMDHGALVTYLGIEDERRHSRIEKHEKPEPFVDYEFYVTGGSLMVIRWTGYVV